MKKLLLCIICMTLCVIGGCSMNKPSTTVQQPPLVETKKSVTIGMVTFPGYAPLHLAKEKGLFKGIDVNLVRIESIGDLRAAMNAGKIDIYAATYDIFQNTDKNTPPGVGFLALDQSNGGDGVVVSEDIKALKDLKGKTVGAEPGLPPYFILQYLLNKEGLSLKDVVFKDLPSSQAGNAFVAGQLDVAGTYEPYLSISKEKRKGAKVLISSADTPGLVVDFLFASDDLITHHPDTLKAISDGRFAAVDYATQYPDESYTIMAKAFGINTTEMKDIKSGIKWLSIQDNKNLFDKSKDNNAYSTFTLVGDILQKNGFAGVRVDANKKLSDTIVSLYK